MQQFTDGHGLNQTAGITSTDQRTEVNDHLDSIKVMGGQLDESPSHFEFLCRQYKISLCNFSFEPRVLKPHT